VHFLRRQGAEAIDDQIARSAVKLPRPHIPASLIFENVHIKAAADTATNLPVLTDQSDLSATAQNCKNTVVDVAEGALPPCPCQRSCDVDDIIAASGWILFTPGDPKPDPEVDPAYLLQFKAAIGKIKRPFRRKPMPSRAETSDTSA